MGKPQWNAVQSCAAYLAPAVHLHGNLRCLSSRSTDKTCIKWRVVGEHQKALEVPFFPGQLCGSLGKAGRRCLAMTVLVFAVRTQQSQKVAQFRRSSTSLLNKDFFWMNLGDAFLSHFSYS